MKNIITSLLLFICCISIHADESAASYSEKWRPQYHYTPAHRWIGDPSGLVHFNGKFHAYCWGAAESTDLIHWEEINRNAIINLPKGISSFTGSVVVDKNNTSGYGKDAFIAAFTSFDQDSKKQSQSIAFSHDEGRTFNYYDLNPVIDTWSTEFRDPTVIWDEQTHRWIMVVAKALEKKVAFYASDDLKHWVWLSDFGPEGDNEKSWECPDLFQLPVEGSDVRKWVLVVSVNWAKEQYFVGEFDGTKFVPDLRYQEPLYIDAGLDYYASRSFQDYDNTLNSVYSIGWVSTWDYAQHVPTEYGKGVWSIPRELSLIVTDKGYRLVQKPIAGLTALRGKPYTLRRRLKSGVVSLDAISKMNNQYEIQAKFSTKGNNTYGLNLCTGSDRHISLTYDTKTQTLILNRTNASDTTIPKFERIAYAKVAPVDNTVNLNIFVDKSVVEIFVNGGECVMTALAFPSDTDCNVELFSLRETTNVELTVYPINSIWK